MMSQNRLLLLLSLVFSYIMDKRPESGLLNILDRLKFVRKSHLGQCYAVNFVLNQTEAQI